MILNKIKMDQKLKCILLVDDDEATNFIHKMVLRQAGCAENIATANNGATALEFLKTSNKGEFPRPDIILLDINMPVMNGWEFLEHYRNLDPALHGKKIILMLTTSLPPEDMVKAEGISCINGFMNKPMTAGMAKGLLQKYFEKPLPD